jgi:hypothetical protein
MNSLTNRETAAVLAGLRLLQLCLEDDHLADSADLVDRFVIDEIIDDAGTLEPLSVQEIEMLCERINAGWMVTEPDGSPAQSESPKAPDAFPVPDDTTEDPPDYESEELADVACHSRYCPRKGVQAKDLPEDASPFWYSQEFDTLVCPDCGGMDVH